MNIELLKKLSFNDQFELESEREIVLKRAAADSLASGKRAVPTIMFFEIIMLGMWFLRGGFFSSMEYIAYFIAYTSLLLCSIAAYIILIAVSRDIDHKYHIVEALSVVYDGFLIVWSVYITAVDTYYNGSFSGIIFITILVIVPIVSFVKPVFYMIFHVAGCGLILIIISLYTKEDVLANIINFSVFAIISLISSLTYYGVRINSYKRQVLLEEAAERDALSGLYNRQKLGQMSPMIWQRCIEKKIPLTCVLCDIDDFKQINDNYGHLVGDEWIQTVANVMKQSFQNDLCFRYGGEEFIVILPGRDLEAAVHVVETIQTGLKALQEKPGGIDVTLSFGIYEGQPSVEGDNIEKFFSKADALMYQAKRNGKNQYCSECEKD